jgi:hypothetical protein
MPNAIEQPEGSADIEVTLTITLVPALSSKELNEFLHLAKQEGESVPERLAKLIRRDLEAA